MTAKSIVDTISLQITAGNSEFIPVETKPTIAFNDIQLTDDTCEERKATITLNETDKVIVIVATATNYGRTQEIQLTMNQDSTTGQWQNLQYSHKGETVYEIE